MLLIQILIYYKHHKATTLRGKEKAFVPILVISLSLFLCLLVKIDMKTKMRIVANKAPPETPSKIAIRFCLCFLLIGTVTCGVSIVEDTLLHDSEENERHGFPVVLINSISVTLEHMSRTLWQMPRQKLCT